MSKGRRTLVGHAAAVLVLFAAYKFFCPIYSWNQKLTVEAENGRHGSLFEWVKLWLRLAFAISFATAASGCGLFSERWEWNQKLTVEVMVDGKIVSGSAVSHVSWQEANALCVYPSGYSGEATVVDLGGGRYLFALIGEDTKYIAQYTLHEELGENRGAYKKLLPKIEKFRGTREIRRDRYPLLVTFADINDPKTVKKLDPADVVAAFGPSVSLKRITLEITNDEVTQGKVEQVLPCLKSGKACIPLNKDLPFGDPMRNIINGLFLRN